MGVGKIGVSFVDQQMAEKHRFFKFKKHAGLV
jgi:hypothetical protein